MDDATYKNWDIHLKKWDIRQKFIAPLLAALLAVTGLVVSARQFGQEQNAQRDRQTQMLVQNAKNEFNRRMWEKQFDTYMKFTRVVGRLAAGNQSREQLDADIKEVLSLYWGEMILFEDDAVRDASKTLRAEIKFYLEEGARDSDRLKGVAEHLVKTLRESLDKSFPPG